MSVLKIVFKEVSLLQRLESADVIVNFLSYRFPVFCVWCCYRYNAACGRCNFQQCIPGDPGADIPGLSVRNPRRVGYHSFCIGQVSIIAVDDSSSALTKKQQPSNDDDNKIN